MRSSRGIITIVLSAVVLAAFVASAAAAAPTLTVGSKAPALKVAKWVKGTPVADFQRGKVYVVEFWATWCGPCRMTIPHLTEMTKKLGDKVTFIGVDIWEYDQDPKSTAYFAKVEKFVQDMGAKMDYNIAIDGPDKAMSTTWMEAAGRNGIPAAFIVGKDGRIAWIGHPLNNLDQVLDQILAGKWSAKAEAKRQSDEAKAEHEREALLKPYKDAMSARDYSKALAEVNKLIKADPAMEAELYYGKYLALLWTTERAAYAYARKLCQGICKDNYAAQYSMARVILDGEKDLKSPSYDLALEMVSRANDIAKGEQPMVLLYLSKAQFKAGDKDKALESGNKALDIVQKNKEDYSEALIKTIEDIVAGYK